MAWWSLTVFNATAIQRSGGAPAFNEDRQDLLPNSSTYTWVGGGQQEMVLGDQDGGIYLDRFDDGEGARQFLVEPLTLSYTDASGVTQTKVFPKGTQVQYEFGQMFSSGYGFGAMRFEDPDVPGHYITGAVALVSFSGQPIPPPSGFNLGTPGSGESHGTQPYASYFKATPVPCFVSGTSIAVDAGVARVEELSTGAAVRLYDGGTAVLLRRLERRVGVAAMILRPDLRPIRIGAGSLGAGLPRRDLLVSPQHRMLMRGKVVQRMFGVPEVLVAARHLCGLDGIAPDPVRGPVCYHHLAFDRHRIVLAEGAPSESLLFGAELPRLVPPDLLRDLRDLVRRDATAADPARPIPPGRTQRSLVRRLAGNAQPALSLT